jgi:hypothetical protein
MVCTSSYGRLISVMLMILSIFVLALPIAVIGQILTEEMENYVERKAQKETRVAKQIGIDESSDLLKKYSSTIERRKSQFNFDLPGELQKATEKRQSMMVKMKSANDILHRAVSFDEAKPSSILKRHGSFSAPNTSDKSSASKLFNSWSEVDEDDDNDSNDPLDKKNGDEATGDDDEDDDDEDDADSVVVKPHVEFLLGSSSPPPLPSTSTLSPKRRVQSKAEAKWNETKINKGKINQLPILLLVLRLSAITTGKTPCFAQPLARK